MEIYIYEDDNMEPYEDNMVFREYFEDYVSAFAAAEMGRYVESFTRCDPPHEHRIISVVLNTQERKLISVCTNGVWEHAPFKDTALSFMKKIQLWQQDDPAILHGWPHEVDAYLNHHNSIILEEVKAYEEFCKRTKALSLFEDAILAHRKGDVSARNSNALEIMSLGYSLSDIAALREQLDEVVVH